MRRPDTGHHWRGGGCWVSGGGKHILTCAHVVAEALGLAQGHREVYIRQGKKYEVGSIYSGSNGDSPGFVVNSAGYFRSLLFLSPSFVLR